MDSLTSINGSLVLKKNASLESLRGLDQVDFRTIDNIAIDDSPLLSECAIQSICDFLRVGRTAQIARNAEHCNSSEEVKSQCTGTTDYLTLNKTLQSFIIYPNPATFMVNFDVQLRGAAHVIISIYDKLGQQIMEVYNGYLPSKEVFSWNASNLNPGLYACMLQVGDRLMQKKLIVIP